MAAVELDPLFMRALALLRSKSKDSTDMLKAMLDEAIGRPSGKFSEKPASPSMTTSKAERSESESKKVPVKRAAEKSAFGDALSSADSGIPPKKAKTEADVRPSRIQPRKPVIDDDDDDDDVHTVEDDDEDTEEEPLEEKEEKTSRSSDEEDDAAVFKETDKLSTSVGGDDDEMWLGLACVVCKELGISAGNTLIECQECHSLYHQKCHSPTVTDTDHNDPRLVWYCAKCKRNMKKIAPKKPSSLPDTLITTATGTSSSSSSSSSSGRESEKSQDSSVNLFRRADPRPSPTSTTSKQQPFGGLASYAANLTSRQLSSKPAQTGSSRIITGNTGTVKASTISGASKTSSISGASKGSSLTGTSKPSSITGSSKPSAGASKPLTSTTKPLTSTTKPSAITGRSFSVSSSSGGSSSRLVSVKTAPGVQRSVSQSSGSGMKSSGPPTAPVVSAAAAKAITSSSGSSSLASSGKAMPQTSAESAMKRLNKMKKKASMR